MTPAANRQKSNLVYLSVCLAALSCGILQELVGVTLDGYSGYKGYLSLALFGLGFLLYGFLENHLGPACRWLPLLGSLLTALLPLFRFHWLPLCFYALVMGALLPLCLGRFLATAGEAHLYVKLGLAFSLYTTGLLLYLALVFLLPALSLQVQFTALALIPLAIFFILQASPAEYCVKRTYSFNSTRKNTRRIQTVLGLGIAVLILLNYAISRISLAESNIPASFPYVDALLRFPLGVCIGALLDKRAYRALTIGLLALMATGAALLLFWGGHFTPLLSVFNFGAMGFIYLLFFLPILVLRTQAGKSGFFAIGFFAYTALVFINIGLEGIFSRFGQNLAMRLLCLACIFLCTLMFVLLFWFFARNNVENALSETGGRGGVLLPQMAPHLNRREEEVFLLVMQGICEKDIAKMLYISEESASNHVRELYQKNGVTDRVSLLEKYAGKEFSQFAAKYGLTPRETEVLAVALYNDKPAKEIAFEFQISERMVQRYLNSIYEKTGVQGRVGLTLLYFTVH